MQNNLSETEVSERGIEPKNTVVLGDHSQPETTVGVSYWIRVQAGRHKNLFGPYTEEEFEEIRRDGVKIVQAEKSISTGTYKTEEIAL